MKWMMVLVWESVSCLTPTELKILQPASSQLDKALNNSGINHGKSPAFLEDFLEVFFSFCRIKKQVVGSGCTWLGGRTASCRPIGFLIAEGHSPYSNLVLYGFQMHNVAGDRGSFCKIFLSMEHWERGETITW